MSDNPSIRVIYTETIKPAAATKTRRIELTPWDLCMISVQYIQKGLLFPAPAAAEAEGSIDSVATRLKTALSLSLVHFFPLAGRLASTASEDGKGTFMYLDCGDQGAEFTLAVADGVTVADVLAPGSDIPRHLIRRFFPLDLAMNHDGHRVPLLAAQLTKLADGMFLGCSLNHTVVDGTSFWHFFNAWAEICRDRVKGEGVEALLGGSGDLLKKVQISRPPVHDSWFIDGQNIPIRIPFSHPDEFIVRFGYPLEFRERLFHFSPKDMAALKERATIRNYSDRSDADGGAADAGTTTPIKNTVISSFQALCALVWRAITRARRLPEDHSTSFNMSIENRRRLQPPLSADYFGNSVDRVATTTTAGDLLSHDLGWAAFRLNRTIAAHTDRAIREAVEAWTAAPVIFRLRRKPVSSDVFMTSSPRFPMYDGSDFGWGTPVAVRCGGVNKFDGKITAYPGREGGGSVVLELTLKPETMAAVESDNELLNAASSTASHAD